MADGAAPAIVLKLLTVDVTDADPIATTDAPAVQLDASFLGDGPLGVIPGSLEANEEVLIGDLLDVVDLVGGVAAVGQIASTIAPRLDEQTDTQGWSHHIVIELHIGTRTLAKETELFAVQ